MSAIADYAKAKEMVKLAITKKEKAKWENRAQQALNADDAFLTNSG